VDLKALLELLFVDETGLDQPLTYPRSWRHGGPGVCSQSKKRRSARIRNKNLAL